MELLVEHVDVWAATIDDKPGAMAAMLEALRDAGADLHSVIARRSPEAPGRGVLFVTPLQGDVQIAAAAQLGFNVAQALHSVRIVGRDRAGVAAEIARRIADAGVNLRGFSASAGGGGFTAYAAVDSLDDARRVMGALERG